MFTIGLVVISAFFVQGVTNEPQFALASLFSLFDSFVLPPFVFRHTRIEPLHYTTTTTTKLLYPPLHWFYLPLFLFLSLSVSL